MSPRKVELYEIIANRMQESDTPTELPQGSTFEIPLSPRAGRRGEREVVLSLDAAFVIFVVFLLLLGTAYLVGVQKGQQLTRESFAPAVAPQAIGGLTPEALETSKPAARAAPGANVPKGRHTLRLTESADHAEILRLKKELLADETVRSFHVEVFVFAPPQKGEKYILALGSFASDADETLARFQKRFNEQKDNELYRYAHLESIDDLTSGGYKIEDGLFQQGMP